MLAGAARSARVGASVGATSPSRPRAPCRRWRPGRSSRSDKRTGAIIPASASRRSRRAARPTRRSCRAHLAAPPAPSRDGPRRLLHGSSTQAGGPQFRVRAAALAGRPRAHRRHAPGRHMGTLHRLLAVELAVTAAALLAAGLLGWWLVRVGLRPLRAMERSADAIAAGELDQRVAGERRSDRGRTTGPRAQRDARAASRRRSRERDATERDLRASEERMRHFVADASHELRTPLAAVSAYAELFERGADRQRSGPGPRHGRHPRRERPHEGARRGAAAAGQAGRGPPDRRASRSSSSAFRRGGPDGADDRRGLAGHSSTPRSLSRRWAIAIACARSSTTCSSTCARIRRRAPPRPSDWRASMRSP